MAQIGNSSRSSPRPFRHRNGTFDLRSFPASTIAGSSAKIAYGDVVIFDVNVATANHKIVKASSGMSTVAPNVLSTRIVGVAVEADEGSPSSIANGSSVVVCCADKDCEFIWPSKEAGSSYQSCLVGTRRAIGYDSTSKFFYADISNSTAGDAALVVTRLYDDVGTTNGRIVAKFLSTATARLISGAF